MFLPFGVSLHGACSCPRMTRIETATRSKAWQPKQFQVVRLDETCTLAKNEAQLPVVYFDYNATTPLHPEVRSVMEPYFADNWGNPSSAHSFGIKADEAIEKARNQVALLVGVEAAQVLFTCSATEANNTALGAALAAPGKKRRILTTATEHSSVLTYCSAVSQNGVEVVIVPVLPSGVIDMHALEAAITSETAVVSVMWANNETGVINPVDQVARLCLQRGVLFHCDAVQAAGKLPVNLRELQIDYLSISGHKIFGPKGVGALILAPTAPFAPLLHGGHQENERRGGTQNVPAIVGFGRAAEIAVADRILRTEIASQLRDELERRILSEITGTFLNGNGAPRLPNTTNIGFAGHDSETLVSLLDQAAICVSSGSACLSDSLTPSHVIQAMTGSYKKAGEAIRFSLSHFNTNEEIDHVVQSLKRVLDATR
jgi:cysteine desulfurase